MTAPEPKPSRLRTKTLIALLGAIAALACGAALIPASAGAVINQDCDDEAGECIYVTSTATPKNTQQRNYRQLPPSSPDRGDLGGSNGPSSPTGGSAKPKPPAPKPQKKPPEEKPAA